MAFGVLGSEGQGGDRDSQCRAQATGCRPIGVAQFVQGAALMTGLSMERPWHVGCTAAVVAVSFVVAAS